MTPSQKCIDLIKQFEGCRLSPYLDQNDVPTIGFGSTYYLDGTKVTMDDPEITQETAEQLLMVVLSIFAKTVSALVSIELNQNQFDALVDFTYNEGPGKFKSSTLLKLLNQNELDQASEEFPKWNIAGGQTSDGLVRRRAAEQALFLSSC